jgi:phage terminase small subunit
VKSNCNLRFPKYVVGYTSTSTRKYSETFSHHINEKKTLNRKKKWPGSDWTAVQCTISVYCSDYEIIVNSINNTKLHLELQRIFVLEYLSLQSICSMQARTVQQSCSRPRNNNSYIIKNSLISNTI